MNEYELEGCIAVKATLKGTAKSIKTTLARCGKISESNEFPISCKLSDPSGVKRLLELSEGSISLKFPTSGKGTEEYNKSLILIFSLFSILNGEYEVHLNDVYPYVIEALQNGLDPIFEPNRKSLMRLKARVSALNDSNCALAAEIIRLSAEFTKLKGTIKIYRDFSQKIIGDGKLAPALQLGRFGVDKTDIDAVSNMLKVEKNGN